MTDLRRHVPELAVDWMLDAPDRRHRSLDGTLCFADISGFTALAERLAQRGRAGGEELVETLSRVFGAMLDLARARGGMLLKFGGDALLLFFEGEEHAVCAAACAVEMQRALRRESKARTSVGPLRLSMSVGLHSGPVDFFLVGGAHRELVVLGPAATRTVATESAAHAGEIAVSSATAALLPPRAVRPRADGELLLRWRIAPLAGRPRVERPADEAIVRALFPRALGELLAHAPPEPEHRVACIAFLRFSGTDALLQRDGRDATARALDATLDTIQCSFDEEGVTLLAVDIDRDGGKVFAASGAPQSSEDDEGAMLRALRRILDQGTPLPLQIGVNRGHVFAAELGTTRRAAYSAMGDTTNTAARIAAKAPPGAIYVHPAVLDYSLTLFDVEPTGPFILKGKKTPQLVYSVAEERGTRSREGIAGFAFVGREAEAGALREALDELAAGRGGAVSIVGATGLGKSRLLREALARAGPGGQLALRAEPYGATSPYRMFRDAIRGLLGVERGGAESMLAALERGVERMDAQLSPLLALLGDVAHIEAPPSPEVAALDPHFRAEVTADAVTRLLAAAHAGPLAIIAEDSHWADDASARLLNRIERECAERPWLLIVARREAESGFHPASSAREIRLTPLPDGAIEALLIAASEAAPLRPHELVLLVKRASGNPLFALESLRAAREAGSLEAVPDSLEAALAAQVDALAPTPRRVLRYASVLGRSFSQDALAELLGSEGASLDHSSLGRLESFLEIDGDDRLRFRNGLVRDTIYAGLAYRLRARLHRAAGETLEQRLGAEPGTNADALALHFSLAGDHARTWRYARMAAERARRAGANADAARLYELALDAGRALDVASDAERVVVYRNLGAVCDMAGMFEKSLDAYRRAAKLVGGDPVARAELLLGEARAHERAGVFSRAMRVLGRALRFARATPSVDAAKTAAKLRAFASLVLYALDRHKDAAAEAEGAEIEARACDEQAALARALFTRDLAALALGVSGLGARMREALSLYGQLHDTRMEGVIQSNLGMIAAMEGRWAEAVGYWGAARAAALKAGDSVTVASTAMSLGELFVKQGHADKAEPLLNEAVRVLRAIHHADLKAYAEIQLARVWVLRRAVAEAYRVSDHAREQLEALGKRMYSLEAATVQGLARVIGGEPEATFALIESAAARAGDAASGLVPMAAHARACALLALGRLEDAEREIGIGLQAAKELGFPYEEAQLLFLRSEGSRRLGRDPSPGDEARCAEILKGLDVRMEAMTTGWPPSRHADRSTA